MNHRAALQGLHPIVLAPKSAGRAVALDLLDDAAIGDLFARVKAEQGRLDLLAVRRSRRPRSTGDIAIELKPRFTLAVGGFTCTERAQENLKSAPGMAAQPNSAAGSSRELPGRVTAALLKDENILEKTAAPLINAELAQAS